MPRRTAEEAAQTRRALIEAGVEHFAQRGYATAKLEELIVSVGVTRGALYHHFGNKRGFFDAVVEHLLEALGQRVSGASDKAGDGWAGIEAGCSVFLGAATDPIYRRVVIIDGAAALGWSRYKELDDRYLTRPLQEGLAAASDGSTDAEALATALSGAMNELALWVAGHDKPRAALRRARATITALIAAARVEL
ncbi:MAG: TetR/AcrR family transcriptional regulator [Nannocystaceae bacterium]|nr:TetR family transcriptional regulator [bacterium]